MNGLSGSFDSIAKSGLNSSLDEDPSYVVYEETTPSIPPGYSSHLDDRYVVLHGQPCSQGSQ